MVEKEYIEREALLENINDTVVFTVRNGMPLPTSEMRGANKVIDRIKSAPVADVVEVKHGEWKEGHYEGGLLDGVNFDKCNICGYERLIEDVKYKTTYKYCPNCGAKMEGKGD